MQEIFTRIWHNLIERTEGPMHFRFILQPVMALIFTIIAAVRDAKNGVVPYLWKIYHTEKSKRRSIIREARKDVGKIFVLAIVLDVIYQLIVVFKLETEQRFYILESIIVGIALAIIPYFLLRGPVNRVVRMFVKQNNGENLNK